MRDEVWVKTWPADPNAKQSESHEEDKDPLWRECLWPDLLNEILADAAPATLFHYTTPAATISILENRELWASDSAYLNDASEYQLAKSLFKELINEAIKNIDDEREHKFLIEVREAGGMMRSGSYVMSLSEDGDLLSQWRAYTPEGGYALGFSSDQLRELARPHGYWLVRCVYARDEQRERVAKVISRLLEWYRGHISQGDRTADDLVRAGRVFAMMWMTWLPPTLKHESYAAEREWRLVHLGLGGDHTRRRRRFRPTKVVIIPYDAVPIGRENGGVCLTEVVIGPGPYQELAREALGNLLLEARVLEYSVRYAAAPHRPL